jgi:hypothetical protein
LAKQQESAIWHSIFRNYIPEKTKYDVGWQKRHFCDSQDIFSYQNVIEILPQKKLFFFIFGHF